MLDPDIRKRAALVDAEQHLVMIDRILQTI